MLKYTVVQHSGVTTGHAEFSHGLEPKGLHYSQLAKVARAGGLIFNDYTEADNYAEAQMYPPGYDGMIPRAPGAFSDVELDGLKIYVPVVSDQPKGLDQTWDTTTTSSNRKPSSGP